MPDSASSPATHTSYKVIIPADLTAEEQAEFDVTREWPIRVELPATAATAVEVAKTLRGRGRQVDTVERIVRAPVAGGGPVPPVSAPADEAFVHQDSGLYPRDVYLRMARAGAFPSQRVGKKVMARWADVRAAFSPRAEPEPETEPSEAAAGAAEDGLARLAASFGLVERKGASGGS